jgi:hypothetical protein
VLVHRPRAIPRNTFRVTIVKQFKGQAVTLEINRDKIDIRQLQQATREIPLDLQPISLVEAKKIPVKTERYFEV